MSLLLISSVALAGLGLMGPASGTRHRDTVAVRGVVYDSLDSRPFAGADVQLLGVDRPNAHFSTRSDSSGRFIVRGVPEGKYVVGFHGPAIDSLGIDVKDRVVEVHAGGPEILLATPSVAALLAGFCGIADKDRAADSKSGLLIGHVRNAHTESAVEDGIVAVSWREPLVASGSVSVVSRSATAKTRSAGWFALCGVPRELRLSVRAAEGADSTGEVDVTIPPTGFTHISLSVGPVASRLGRITGHVSDTHGQAVSTATVVIAGDAQLREARTGTAGEFVIDGAPVGSQSLLVRAVGYAERTLIVQVAEGAATTTDVVLERVTALPAMIASDSVRQAHLAEFFRDKKIDVKGSYFVQPSRVEGFESTQTVCQLLNGLRGVPPVCSSSTGPRRTGRPSLRRPSCEGFLLNGAPTDLSVDDLYPDDILGVEVFAHGIPEKYRETIEGNRLCAVAVWTKCAGSVVVICGKPASTPPPDLLRGRELPSDGQPSDPTPGRRE